jgi:A/G-specific adenine glycosylase
MNLTESLLSWYEQHRRPLPWRETRDPYTVWLSEVILQQTRVSQGMPYFLRFRETYPDVQSMAAASEQDILKLWQGLGYYSRARNMHSAAKEVVGNHGGIFPQTAAGLKKLKGVGDYTAAAIASICYGEAVPVVDGNVMRVISRLYALDVPADSGQGRSRITELAGGLMNAGHPGTFNQAVMELGSLVCSPKNPSCDRCPLAFGCQALKMKSAEKFPIMLPKKAAVIRHIDYLVIRFRRGNNESVLMRKRSGKDIWKNMYDFPSVELQGEAGPGAIAAGLAELGIPDAGGHTYHISTSVVHLLSHRRLIVRFITLNASVEPKILPGLEAIPLSGIHSLPLPRLIEKFANSLSA